MSTFGDSTALRAACRDDSFFAQTSGQAHGYAQANLVILPKIYVSLSIFSFVYPKPIPYPIPRLSIFFRNPKPCPLLEVLEPGVFSTRLVASNADIRTDLPKC
jgi:uncharacterized protein YcsI (UPF0317 family)